MKRIIIALLAIVATVNVSAQEVRFGVAGGVNFSWERSKLFGTTVTSDSYVGFQAGVKAEIDMVNYIADGFFVETGLLYNLKGGNYADAHTNLGYLQLPINLGYRLPLSGDMSLLAGVGPYLALGILGKDVETVADAKIKTDVFGDYYKRFDFGLNYKLGLEMWDQWQFYLGFEHGLVNMAKTEEGLADGDKCKLINLYIGTAFMF